MYDAILVLSFGGPEGPDDVIPFLENVLRGKNVPRERLLEVAGHYNHFGGVSPINQQCRDLISALRAELDSAGISLPIYWGNRNWHPMLADTLTQMHSDGIRRALCYITSGFSCYSGCRQYREDIIRAKEAADTPELEIHKLRVFYNHPDFVDVISRNVQTAIDRFDRDVRGGVQIAFTAHSIPLTMSSTSDYEKQLTETCRLVSEKLNLPADRWKLVYQSRSGRPSDPWLEPDICDYLQTLADQSKRRVVISPVGFLSDHMEVLFDLDDEARRACDRHGISMQRAATPGHDAQFVRMIRKLIQERLGTAEREAIGRYGPNHDVCPEDCCPAPPRRPAASQPA
ncbi:MAG: ferrochelatase [Planctomycetaceae bacterium]